VTTIFDDDVVGRMVEGLAADEQHAPVVVNLPRNQTSTLRIRQTGHTEQWWSIHELRVWEQTAR
jgi:hypothetical protein